ncbi:MAG: hypothetical protein NTV05_09085 [Acidobacteria bacterium]|nr:hypothetical protein [Acidobacteriota bacterium]
MTRRFAFLAILLAVALAVPSFAQAPKIDFSGKWIQDMEKSDPAPAGRGGGAANPQQITITQTPTELTIERTTGQGTQKTVYKLDGSESSNAGRGGDVKSKTNWDGPKLVTKYQQTMGENTVDVTETRSLETDGTLKVVTARGTNTRTVVFKKG